MWNNERWLEAKPALAIIHNATSATWLIATQPLVLR